MDGGWPFSDPEITVFQSSEVWRWVASRRLSPSNGLMVHAWLIVVGLGMLPEAYRRQVPLGRCVAGAAGLIGVGVRRHCVSNRVDREISQVSYEWGGTYGLGSRTTAAATPGRQRLVRADNGKQAKLILPTVRRVAASSRWDICPLQSLYASEKTAITTPSLCTICTSTRKGERRRVVLA